MRGVHGVDVAGGTFPTQIWGNYMRFAKGPSCANFRRPSQPANFSPFYGKYAKQGGGGSRYGQYRVQGGGGTAYRGGGYSDGYNPRAYAPLPSPSSGGGSGSPSSGGSYDGGGGSDVPGVPDL
jgi:penicillin-binding protein 1A